MKRERVLAVVLLMTGLLAAACGGQVPPAPTGGETTVAGAQGSSGTASVSTGVVMPEDPSQAGLAPYPDETLDAIPATPISATFLVEHRTALNGAAVTLRGVVVATLLGEKACPPDRGMCAQPSLFLADTADPNRDPNYDIRVLVSEAEREEDYPIGATVEVRVHVDSSPVAVVVQKVY